MDVKKYSPDGTGPLQSMVLVWLINKMKIINILYQDWQDTFLQNTVMFTLHTIFKCKK